MRLIVDSTPVPIEPGDSILIAMLRAGLHPTGGGCLCLAGDCPHCLATVDGISYTRTCLERARPGVLVERQHLDRDVPPLIPDSTPDVIRPRIPARSASARPAVPMPITTTSQCR